MFPIAITRHSPANIPIRAGRQEERSYGLFVRHLKTGSINGGESNGRAIVDAEYLAADFIHTRAAA